MELTQANQQANRLLDRERKAPTVSYQSLPIPPEFIGTIYSLTPHQFEYLRDSRPRKLRQNPRETEFVSDNFELLASICDSLPPQQKPIFDLTFITRIAREDSFHSEVLRGAGRAQQSSSELPLVAEFLVRRGSKSTFIQALEIAAVSPGLTLMLMQLEDMIAFNFTVFTDDEYDMLRRAVERLEQNFGKFAPKVSTTRESNTAYILKKELPVAFENLKDVIEQAHIAHIKLSVRPEPKKIQAPMATTPIHPMAANPMAINVLPHLHKDLQGFAHYFREGKPKEAVRAAFTRVENRLNEIRDSAVDGSVKAVSGPTLVHSLFRAGILELPYPALAKGNQKGREAYLEHLRAFLASGIGWFRNSYSHEPHNLPDLSEWDALELLFVASCMLRVLDSSLATST